MKYTVMSGDFRLSVDSDTPRGAAEQALTLWKLKQNKPSLAKILVVVKPDSTEVYLPTQELMAGQV